MDFKAKHNAIICSKEGQTLIAVSEDTHIKPI
jgi:hypothetical protein